MLFLWNISRHYSKKCLKQRKEQFIGPIINEGTLFDIPIKKGSKRWKSFRNGKWNASIAKITKLNQYKIILRHQILIIKSLLQSSKSKIATKG